MSMKNISKTIKSTIHSITQLYYKSSNWAKVLIIVVLLLIVITITKTQKEGYETQDNFDFKSGDAVYDDFYATIYDHLVYNNILDDYVVTELVNRTHPSSESIILDIGSGTGNIVAALASKGLHVTGVDSSEAMITKAKANYPNYDFEQGDVTRAQLFNHDSFTHILCLYFTLYYMPDKSVFFKNCMNWLMPGGFLVVHIVDREQFDPIIPPANPLITLTPQRYASKRITTSKVTFDDFVYQSDFQLDKNSDSAKFVEKFSNKKSGKTFRKQEHQMYMEGEPAILAIAQSIGFIIQGKIDLIKAGYEYNYLYIFQKPE
uniref:Methyltransferase domain-containing protein n=1 Tax=viral metagenome TaxID=1070528 RepID=A0A6C0HXM2_9ZZZZ